MSRVDERPTPSSVALNDETLHGHGVSWSWSILKNMSQRDFYPRWGYDLIMNAKSGRVASDNTIGADIFSAMSTFYIPGLFSHNHLVLNAAYEYQNDMSYRYSSAFRFSRGYDSYYFDHLSLASANYTFPLWNADARIFDYIYFRRFGFNFFYDHLLGKNNGSSEFTFDSYGAELLVESAFFRNINLNLNWGIRYAQRLDLDEADSYELFLRTSF